jgi:hypothetical protein
MTYVRKTVRELLEIKSPEQVVGFLRELINHTERGCTIQDSDLLYLVKKYYKNERVKYNTNTIDINKKVMSWIDCIEFLQNSFDGKMDKYDVKLCFEYNTPDNFWIDVIVLDKNRITILEFKSGESIDKDQLSMYEEQLDAYCNKITHANVNVWQKIDDGLKVRGFLVYTNEKMKSINFQRENVLVCEEFFRIVDSFNDTMDDQLETNIMKFDPDFDSSTLNAFITVLEEKILDNIYIPDKCKDRCVDIIDATIDTGDLESNPVVNIVFVNGKPGSGKTGVALSLISEYCKRKKSGTSSKRIKYATGNGNLYSLFNQANNSKNTNGITSFTFSRIRGLYKIDDIIKNRKNYLNYKSKTEEDIIIIDEAQRMWSEEKIAFDPYASKIEMYPETVLEEGLSEPVMVLIDLYKAALDRKKSKTVLFLVGNGQEIYTGEELGEEQIIQAVNKVNHLFINDVRTRVFSSKKYQILNEVIQDDSAENSKLFLMTEKRNQMNSCAGSIVDALLDDFDSEIVEKSPFVILGTREELNSRYKIIKEVDPRAKQRLFIASYDQKKMKNYFVKNKKSIDNNQLYNFFSNDLGSDLNHYATEFNAQGLEIDYAYFIWGSRIKRRYNSWEVDTDNVPAIYKYYKKIEEFQKQHPKLNIRQHIIDQEIRKMIINAYRVLLTRAQKKTFIFVEDDETRDYLMKFFQKGDEKLIHF